jgi:hypothetical protein
MLAAIFSALPIAIGTGPDLSCASRSGSPLSADSSWLSFLRFTPRQ